jgi:hypothetical protein
VAYREADATVPEVVEVQLAVFRTFLVPRFSFLEERMRVVETDKPCGIPSFARDGTP